MFWLIVVLVISSITLLSMIFIPVTEKGIKDWGTKKQGKVEKHLALCSMIKALDRSCVSTIFCRLYLRLPDILPWVLTSLHL